MDDLYSAYNQWHEDINTKETSSELHLCRWHLEAYNSYNSIENKKVLEVGCGRGDFSIFLSNHAANVHGTDFSEAAVSIAKEKAKTQSSPAYFSVADAQKLPFGNGSFDIIYSCECLEHIPNPQRALDEFFRVLKPGGTAVVTTENYSNGMIIPWLQSWITKKPFNSGDKVQPIENFFLYWNVKRMMQKSGFKVKMISGWHYVFLILPKNKNWIVNTIKNNIAKKLLKPFARHMTFLVEKN